MARWDGLAIPSYNTARSSRAGDKNGKVGRIGNPSYNTARSSRAAEEYGKVGQIGNSVLQHGSFVPSG